MQSLESPARLVASSHARCSPLVSRSARSCVTREKAKAGPRAVELALANTKDSPALTDAFRGATAVFILPPSEFDPEPGYPEAKEVIDSVVKALTAALPTKVLCLSTIGADAVHDNLLSQRTMMESALRGFRCR